jgi:TPP-dependent pyruvate/acetoin dehydrogenase alpha subunit
MKVSLTGQDLIKFEEDVCAWFGNKLIRAPVHLDNGNEDALIKIFREHVGEEDWIVGSWRQHYKCLLKGVPREELKAAIIDGKSISLCFPEYRIISSAIVGGVLPIAVGIAMGIQRQALPHKVVCFMGEMTSETGIAHECIKYATNCDLPLLFVIEDNEKSVCTPTLEAWEMKRLTYAPESKQAVGPVKVRDNVIYYKYQTKYPHAGTGQRINF